jgi:nitrite reductase (NADH) large subunit
MRHVIIGNGIAGVTAAETIRGIDPESSITIISGEAFPPYSRPMISMVLEGSVTADRLPIRSPDFYESLRIQAVVGQWVRRVDVENREVVTERGEKFPYDRLLIATGADPRAVRAPGHDLANIFFMRTEADVKAMLKALPATRSAVVLGGGLVGFKAAYGLLRRGIKVKLLIRSGYPLSMQVDEYAGKMLLQELVDNGLEVQVGAEVASFEGRKSVEEVVLTDGARLQCDMVVIGKGVRPALSFLPLDRVETDLGIIVDDYLRTSVPEIFAAGDVAEHFDIARKARWVNAIWPVAVEQGHVAGMNMAGKEVPYRGSLSRNVIRIFGMDVLTAGVVNPPPDEDCRCISHHDERTNTYRKLVLRGDKLIGFTMVNAIEQGGVLMSLIHHEIPIPLPAGRLLSPLFNYAQLLGK